MIAMSLAEIARVSGGEVHGDGSVLVTAPASQDSRAVEPGGLYVAILGERVDGHEFAAGALAAGAAGVLGSRPTDAPTVVVHDPIHALGLLARHVRNRLDGLTVFALTGSQGKTGTKDYLAQVLAGAGRTVATAGNLNNELGVPLTVLRADEDTRFLVVEMGARGIGHIDYLCGIARPDIAAVINVGTAHMSEFGSREAIAQAKGEIIEGLAPTGTAVINASDELVSRMGPRTRATVVRFGEGGDVVWEDVSFDDMDRPSGMLRIGNDAGRVNLQQVGAHQLVNAAAAAAMAQAAGVPTASIVGALSNARSLSRWRMEITEVTGGPVVINDAYNANPASMRAAISALAAIGERRRTRTIAVLGEMRELGADAVDEHRAIGADAAEAGIDVLLAVGEAAAAMATGAEQVTDRRGTAVCVADRDAALAWLRENIRAGDVVLVKASRGAALELVADGLIDMGPSGDEDVNAAQSNAEETQQ
ncbi:MAG TPA: UDP-N-acetylmuramoyl-tripeptide--D-alanyl-D-alanine ligase [Nocardioides sp.]